MSTEPTPRTFDLGGELTVDRLGFGAMRLTGQPGNFGPYDDWRGGLDLLRRAAELGVEFFDSARSYGPLWADRLVGEAFAESSHRVVLATKGGIDKPAPGQIVVDGSPATLARQVDEALTSLRVERIDLFQLHRVDPATPIEDSVGALDAARRAGKIRLIGLSNVDREQLDRALAVAPIASVQNRFNQAEQAQSDLVDYTADHGIAFIPYGPLGAHPMRQGATLPPREALAWLLRRAPNVLVIPGTTSIAHLEENVSAWELV
ncbi:MAG: aldo/keto reductase [Acidobacteriota bacterium]